jgi:hypothetical protein
VSFSHTDFKPPTRKTASNPRISGFRLANLPLIVLGFLLITGIVSVFMKRPDQVLLTSDSLLIIPDTTFITPNPGSSEIVSKSLNDQENFDQASAEYCRANWKNDSSRVVIFIEPDFFSNCLDMLERIQIGLGRSVFTFVESPPVKIILKEYRAIQLTLVRQNSGSYYYLSCIMFTGDKNSKPYCLQGNMALGDSAFNYGKARYCAGAACLSGNNYQFPIDVKTCSLSGSLILVSSVWPVRNLKVGVPGNCPVRPILPGWVVNISYTGLWGRSVRLYHGGDKYSTYGNLASLKPNLLLSDYLTKNDKVGYGKTENTSINYFTLKVEQEGRLISPSSLFSIDTTFIKSPPEEPLF